MYTYASKHVCCLCRLPLLTSIRQSLSPSLCKRQLYLLHCPMHKTTENCIPPHLSIFGRLPIKHVGRLPIKKRPMHPSASTNIGPVAHQECGISDAETFKCPKTCLWPLLLIHKRPKILLQQLLPLSVLQLLEVRVALQDGLHIAPHFLHFFLALRVHERPPQASAHVVCLCMYVIISEGI